MASNERVGITLDVLPGTFAGVTAALGGFNELVAATSMFSKAVADSTSVVDAMTLTLGVALAGAAWESAKAFGELERGMKIVQAVSGQTSSQISILTQQANEFSVKYKMGIDDITAGLQTLGRAGLSNVNTQLDTMQAGLQAAKIQGMELNDALEKIVATTALLGGDLKSANFGAQAEKLTSQLLSTAMTAPIDLNDVVQTLSYSGGTAAAAGINIQNDDALYDYLGAISAFAQKGVKGSMAGTAMRAFFTKPASQDTSVVEALGRLDMKASDLWEPGGNAMRPVSEQIELIHKQMDKLHMSTLDQIELWGKIVGPKMGQQMMKLDESTIKETSREIRQTASATELANMTMDNFLSDIATLEQQAQKSWRSYGEAALAWISPVVKGISGLFNILGTDIGGFPIFQQFGKMAIILVISKVIQSLGAIKNLFKSIISELYNMAKVGAQDTRTVEEQAAAEKKRYEAMGLTKSQAESLVGEEGKITSGLSTSNKVLAEFLAKLNQAVTLMSELATLSRATSMNTISTISSAQHNRLYNNGAEGMSNKAWFDQHQGNVGNLTKNEFAQLSLRHGMNESDLLKIYDSKQFQAYAKNQQGKSSAFPTAVSLEKYLQQNQKGLYDPKTNPVMGIVQGVKTDTGIIATNTGAKGQPKTNIPTEEIKNDVKVKTEEIKNTSKSKDESLVQSGKSKDESVKKTATNAANTFNRTVTSKADECVAKISQAANTLSTRFTQKMGAKGADIYNMGVLNKAINQVSDVKKQHASFLGSTGSTSSKYIEDFKKKGISYRNDNIQQQIRNLSSRIPKEKEKYEQYGKGATSYYTDKFTLESLRKVENYHSEWMNRQKKLISELDAISKANISTSEKQNKIVALLDEEIMREGEIQNELLLEYDKYQAMLTKQDDLIVSLEQQKTDIIKQREEAQKQLKAAKAHGSKTEETANLQKVISGFKNQEKELQKQIAHETLMRREALINLNRLAFQIQDSEVQIDGYQKALKIATESMAQTRTLTAAQEKKYLTEEEQAIAALMRDKTALEEQYGVLEKQVADENLVERGMRGEIEAIEQLKAIGIKRKDIENQIYTAEIRLKDAIERYYMMFSAVPGVAQPRGARTVGPFTPVNFGPQTVGPTTPIDKTPLITPFPKNVGFSQAQIAKAAEEANRQAILKNPSLSAQSSGYGAFLGLNAKDQFKAMSASNQTVTRGEIAKQLEIQSNNERTLAVTSARNVEEGFLLMRAKEKEVLFAQNTLQSQQKLLAQQKEQLIAQRKEKVPQEEINQTKKQIANTEKEIEATEKEIAQLERERMAATKTAAVYAKSTLAPMNQKTGKREYQDNMSKSYSSRVYGTYNRFSLPQGGLANMKAPAKPPSQLSWLERPNALANFKNALNGLPEKLRGFGSSLMSTTTKTRVASSGGGFWSSMRTGFFAGNSRHANLQGQGKLWNWMQMGMTGMVDWNSIRKANTGLSTLGKMGNIAGGALGSLGMMFGPAEVAMMGFSMVMQGVQAAQQKYKEELEKINSQLSEARENFEKAEESYLEAYEKENGGEVTQEQKDEALLNLYANGQGNRGDNLDSYRARVYGALNKIEINTRKKAEKENDYWWGSQGGMQKGFWSHWDETWGWVFDNRNKATKDELNEQFRIAKENAKTTNEDRTSKWTEKSITNANDLEKQYQKYIGMGQGTTYQLDYTLSHYANWIEDLEDYTEQAKYATALMDQEGGIDSTGITGGSELQRTFGTDINKSYRQFEASLQKIPATVKTQIANSINADPDFYKSMQRQMFTFKDGKLQRIEGKEAKILQAIRQRVGNITEEQAKQTLILSTLSSIHDFVQNQIQPQLLANVESSMSAANTLGLTYTSGGYTGNSTDAVHQGVMTISAQLVSLIEQKAMENMSLMAQSTGIDFGDLTDLARASETGLTQELRDKDYDEHDADQAKNIMSSSMEGMYNGVYMSVGKDQEEAYKLSQEKFKQLFSAKTINGETFLPELPDMFRTYEKWGVTTLAPFIEEQWAKSLQDTGAEATGAESTDKDKDKDKSKDTSNKKNWVNLAICNKKEIPKLNVNLFKKPPNFTILNRNFKLRDVNVNTADDAKSIQNAVKNSIIEIQNRSNPKIIQDDAAEYDPLSATEGNTLPVGTKKTE